MDLNIPPVAIIESEILRRELEGDYLKFVKWVFKSIYKREFLENFHHVELCKIMEKVFSGELSRAIINVGPRCSKTELVVVCFIPWCYAITRDCNFLHISYSLRLAAKNSTMSQRIIESDEFQSLWPLKLFIKEKGKSLWTIEGGGSTYAVNSGGAVTGFGAGVSGQKNFSGAILLDDPMKAGDERYELKLDMVKENFDNVVSSRINNPTTPVVLIMQRLHEDDLSGHLLTGQGSLGRFDHFCFPGIMEDQKKSYDKREAGDILWPEKFSKEKLEHIRKVSPLFFAGQIQQRPAPVEGLMIKRAWIKTYDVVPTEFNHGKFVSVDMNMKESGSSNACLSLYGCHDSNVYLLDQAVGKWSFPEAEQHLRSFIPDDYRGLLIEEKANGYAMIAALSGTYHSIHRIQVDASKEYRLNEVSMLYSGGNVWYPSVQIAPWVNEHLHEIITFPNGRYDDRVDAETQMLKFSLTRLFQSRFFDY